MAKITIQKVVFGGKGLSKLEDGKTCFVPYVLPDEEVEIEINKDKKISVKQLLKIYLNQTNTEKTHSVSITQ